MVSYLCLHSSHAPCGFHLCEVKGVLRKGYISLASLVGAIVFSRFNASWRNTMLWECAAVSASQFLKFLKWDASK